MQPDEGGSPPSHFLEQLDDVPDLRSQLGQYRTQWMEPANLHYMMNRNRASNVWGFPANVKAVLTKNMDTYVQAVMRAYPAKRLPVNVLSFLPRSSYRHLNERCLSPQLRLLDPQLLTLLFQLLRYLGVLRYQFVGSFLLLHLFFENRLLL